MMVNYCWIEIHEIFFRVSRNEYENIYQMNIKVMELKSLDTIAASTSSKNALFSTLYYIFPVLLYFLSNTHTYPHISLPLFLLFHTTV